MKYRRTAGVGACVTSTGYVIGITEFYGAESKTQVYLFILAILSVMSLLRIAIPTFLAYDDGCHLYRFQKRRANRSEFLCKLISQIIIVVDRMHFKNHVDSWCKQHMNPNKFEQLKGLNTQSSEQTFSWLKGFKASVCYMNESHFLIFLLRMCHLRNKRLIKMRNMKSTSK
eukprot:Lithocolla_globosa_v1_NODE_262_length_4766_cov_108.495648.p2 type:complete len:171 gc:universal NODE_262_length_4766_cov_108.495648:595-83(-)